MSYFLTIVKGSFLCIPAFSVIRRLQHVRASWEDIDIPFPVSVHEIYRAELSRGVRRRVMSEITPLYPGYGTHFSYVFVGTPPRRQSVIVDTGSHVTAFPCVGCELCGSHTDNYWDPKQSTSSYIPQCLGQPCHVGQSYAEGSSWDGYYVIDQFWVGGITGNTVQSDVAYSTIFKFACQTSEIGLFRSQLADGIMGMSMSDDTLPVALREAGITDTRMFALCYSINGGIMTLGGVDQRVHAPASIISYASLNNNNDWFSVSVIDISVEDRATGDRLSIFNILHGKGAVAIVDSGTTDTYLPSTLSRAFGAAFERLTSITFSENEILISDTQLENIPNIIFTLEGVDVAQIEVTLSWNQYVEKLDDGKYAFDIYFDSQFILGANFMIGRNVIFDPDGGKIGFANSNCDIEELSIAELSLISDEVKALPMAPALESRHFSGYLNITSTEGANNKIHYYFVESESNPTTDDLIFIFSSRPGCSSMNYAFDEIGPWWIESNSSLASNQYSWSKFANLVFVDSSSFGAGFSFEEPIDTYAEATQDEGDGHNSLFGDYAVSILNFESIKSFLKKFPEMTNNTFYLFSSVYGGHMLPQLTLLIFDSLDFSLSSHFGGFIVGNPVVSFQTWISGQMSALWGRQLIPARMWKNWCSKGCANSTSLYEFSSDCEQLFREARIVASKMDSIDLSGSCSRTERLHEFEGSILSWLGGQSSGRKLEKDSNSASSLQSHPDEIKSWRQSQITPEAIQDEIDSYNYFNMQSNLTDSFVIKDSLRLSLTPELLLLPLNWNFSLQECSASTTNLEVYLRDLAVQIALHVVSDNATVPVQWSICNRFPNVHWPFGWPAADTYANIIPLFNRILQHNNRRKDFKILVVVGDSDTLVPSVSVQEWIYDIYGANMTGTFGENYEKPEYPINFWEQLVDPEGQPIGYRTLFGNGITFATVHAAGRAIGHDKPAVIYQIVYELLRPFTVSDSSILVTVETVLIALTSALAITVLLCFIYFKFFRQEVSNRPPDHQLISSNEEYDEDEEEGIELHTR